MSQELLTMEAFRSIAVFFHLGFFALAFYTLLACDYAVWSMRWNPRDLQKISIQMKLFLSGLWITGTTLIVFETGLDFSAMADSPKLLFKLIVVTILTVNGLLIHQIAIPIMANPNKVTLADARKLTAMSVVSTSHWVLAAFIGCFKPFGMLSASDISILYMAVLAVCAIAFWIISPATKTRINHRKAMITLTSLGLRRAEFESIPLLFLDSDKYKTPESKKGNQDLQQLLITNNS